MTIMLTEWRCHLGHCAFAVPWDSEQHTPEEVEQEGQAQAKEQGLNPWCGICGGGIEPETQPTRFVSWDVAMREFGESEVQQVMTRLILDAQGLTHDGMRQQLGDQQN